MELHIENPKADMLREKSMETKQPTQEQREVFWEWCGFRLYEDTTGDWKDCFYWHNPPNTEEWGATWLPPIDLNNLFKYAIPKLREENDIMLTLTNTDFLAEVTQKSPMVLRLARSKDSALALFWAIWEVIKKDGS